MLKTVDCGTSSYKLTYFHLETPFGGTSLARDVIITAVSLYINGKKHEEGTQASYVTGKYLLDAFTEKP